MQEVSFEETLELIRARDPRYAADAYHFVREALDFTQKATAKESRGRIRHVTGQELLRGLHDYALAQFGPMAVTVLEEWGIRSCRDFGEIVFNMVEAPGSSTFSVGDFKDPVSLVAKLKEQSDPVSSFLWDRFSESARQEALQSGEPKLCEALLAKELNQIIKKDSVYQPERFAAVSLSTQARSLIERKLNGIQLARLNRLLLEEAYPREITKSPGLLAKTEKDSREDFDKGYDFWEAFRKPFLPAARQEARSAPSDVKPA